MSTILATEGIHSDHNHDCLYPPSSQHRPGTQGTVPQMMLLPSHCTLLSPTWKNKNTYVRMLFVDYSSAFNTIVPATQVAKLQTLGLNRSLCSWILDFLTGRSQVVRMGNNTSSPLTQHRQDQGWVDQGGGFQETEQRTHTHHHRQDTCGAGKQL